MEIEKLNCFPLIAFIAVLLCCCYRDHTVQVDTQVQCEVTPDTLIESYLIKIFDEDGTPVLGTSLHANEKIGITVKGCIVVAKNFRKEFTVQYGSTKGLRIDPTTLKEGINKAILQRYQGSFDVWSYCGDTISNNQMFLKFTNNTEQGIFYDRNYNKHFFETNNLNCAKVPVSIGMVKTVDKQYYVYKTNPVVFLNKPVSGTGDFLSNCIIRGTSDPIVKALSEKYETKDCNEIFIQAKQEREFHFEFIGKNIEDLTTLRGLDEIRIMNLRGNNLVSLAGLEKLPNLSVISLQNNNILFFNELPPSVRHIAINWNPVYSLKTLSHLNLFSLKASDLPIEDLSGIESQASTLIAMDADNLTNLTKCDSLEKMDTLKQLRANSNRCIGRLLTERKLPRFMDRFEGESNGVTDISFVKYYSTVEYLNLNYNDIKSLEPIKYSNVRNLLIDFNRNIFSFLPLNSHPTLTFLSAHGSNIRDISFLARIPNLESFYASYNQIEDITPMLESPSLKTVRILNNPVKNCPENSPLESLNEQCRAMNKND